MVVAVVDVIDVRSGGGSNRDGATAEGFTDSEGVSVETDLGGLAHFSTVPIEGVISCGDLGRHGPG